ncbi:AAA family ATPase [Empedobacter brevis]
MKINSISFYNGEQQWGFDEINFFDITLLVGLSGVGKTQILDSINSLKHIASGSSENGVKWELNFTNANDINYTWKGEFETLKNKNIIFSELYNDNDKTIKPKLLNEKLIDITNNVIIIDRLEDKFYFNNENLPKLNSHESAISLLKETDTIKDIYESFKLIIYRDHTQKEGVRFGLNKLDKLKEHFNTFEKIKESDLNTMTKLSLIYDTSIEHFNIIVDRFKDVFNQIEDVKVESIIDNELPSFFGETSIIQIKEYDVDYWIPHYRMSSGMLRTLIHIAEMYLWKEGTVILIDEFENSLGVNCIDVLTEDLINNTNNIQFIATSHHPYIINKIPTDYWKIVNRNGGKISTFNAKDARIEKSHHDNFILLTNNPFYKGLDLHN